MKIQFLSLSLIFLMIGCSGEKSDEYLLKKDREELKKSLDSNKVNFYKFGKIIIRASIETDSDSEEFIAIQKDLDDAFIKIEKLENGESLSFTDYVSIYKDYVNVSGYVSKTDEDIFPTITEVLNFAYGEPKGQRLGLAGETKVRVEAVEHAALSVLVLLSKSLGKEISLYECAETKPDNLADSELKSLIQYFRGLLFFEKGFNYLSEDEITRNITWLNDNQDIDMTLTRSVFNWNRLNNQNTHIGFHSINHLFRGMNRLMMEREIDEERALEDFEAFLEDSKKLGLDNELIWAIETYMYLKKENNDKVIASLTKLKSSHLLSNKDKEKIDESIAYLEKREPGSVLNGVYDKYFISKIVTLYIYEVLSKVDWEKVLKENNVPYTDEIFSFLEKMEKLSANVEEYTNGKSLQEKGKGLFDKARKLLDEE